MLDVRDVRKSFGGFTAIGGVSLDVPPYRHHRGDRPERRRQIDFVQSLDRSSACRHRQRHFRGPRHHRRAAACDLPDGHRTLVPAHQYFQETDRVRECAGRADRAWRRRAEFLGPGRRPLPRRNLADPGIAQPHGPGRGRVGFALARQPEAARARDRARKRSEIAAARRADRRHVGVGNARRHPPARAHRVRAQAHFAVHRARHGCGVSDRAEDRRAASGQTDRRGQIRRRCAPTPKCGASISGGGNEPPRPSTTSTPLTARRARCSAFRSRSTRANACACSAAMASARPRPCARSWA